MTTNPSTPVSRESNLFARHWGFFVVLAAAALVALVRMRLVDLPLERDEGEYAYAGQLLLQGVPPYELAYNMKFPGTPRLRADHGDVRSNADRNSSRRDLRNDVDCRTSL